jgi:hypothetical protein
MERGGYVSIVSYLNRDNGDYLQPLAAVPGRTDFVKTFPGKLRVVIRANSSGFRNTDLCGILIAN